MGGGGSLWFNPCHFRGSGSRLVGRLPPLWQDAGDQMQVTAESKFIGLGVAGNFAGHLEQAGEASDFVAVVVRDTSAPKALFPFYVP
ncbi:MAG: DUF5718 family protein, partial [Aeromonas bestiarum]